MEGTGVQKVDAGQKMQQSNDRIEKVGEHHDWLEKTAEIRDRRDLRRWPDSDYEAKVNVYEDRVQNWFLIFATDMSCDLSHPGNYVALSIALAYVEGVEQYRRGEATPKKMSGEWFEASAKRIFPGAPVDAIKRLWKEVRNGLFHDGFTKGPTLVSFDADEALTIDGRYLKINPAKFVKAVVDDFSAYICKLRKDRSAELGRNFEVLWDETWKET